MARLPTLDDLGARPVPVSQRQVASNPYAGAVGEAVGNIGEAASKAGQVLFEQQDKLQYAAAKTAMLKADVTARQELQDDPDYETWGTRYADKMKAAREQATAMLGNHGDRRLFEADAQLDEARGSAELSSLANGRRHQARVGTLDQASIDLQETGQNAPDDPTREAVIGTFHGMVDDAVKAGTITAADGVARKHAFAQDHVTQRVEALNLQGDTAGAAAYFEAHRGMLDGDREIRLATQLHDATENQQNYAAAADAVAGRSPASDPYGAYPLTPYTNPNHRDKREDGSDKGAGWLGPRQRPDGKISSEISAGVTINGKEQDIPLMVPGLTKPEMDYLMTHDPDLEKNPNFFKDMPSSIMDKAETFAKKRIAEGKSPFRQPNETTPFDAQTSAPAGAIGATGMQAVSALPAQQSAPTGRARLNGTVVSYAMQAHGLSEPQARGLAALIEGEGGKVDNTNPAGGGHGAYGLFQVRDSGGQQALKARYGDHPTMQQQVDFFLKDYSAGNKAFWNAKTETEALQALATGQRAGSGTQGIVDRGMAALGRKGQVPAGSGNTGNTDQAPDLGTIYARIDAKAAQEGWLPERIQKVKSIAAAQVNQQKAVITQHQDDAFDGALAKADALGAGFTDVSQLGDQFYQAKATDQHRLRVMADANLAASVKPLPANGDTIRSLKNMAVGTADDQAKFAGLNLAQYKPFMTPGEYEDITVAQTKAKVEAAKGPTEWSPRTGIQNAITWGEKFGGVDLSKDDPSRYRVYRYMDDRARQWSAQNHGKVPTDTEYQQFFREATQEEHQPRYIMGIQRSDQIVRSYQIVSSHYKPMIIREFRAINGRDPTEAEIQNWFERMGEPLGKAEGN